MWSSMAAEAAARSCARIASAIFRWPAREAAGRPGCVNDSSRDSRMRSEISFISRPSNAEWPAVVTAA